VPIQAQLQGLQDTQPYEIDPALLARIAEDEDSVMTEPDPGAKGDFTIDTGVS
jgi:hypothetical protein